MMWLLPSWVMASVVKGTVTLGNSVIEAEYTINGATAQLGSGYNACISQYAVGQVVVPTSITVGGTTYPVTAVSPLAFRMCTLLTRVTLPEGVTRVGDFAFQGCQAMLEIELPSTLATVGSGAFIGLPNLQNVIVHAATPPVWEYNDVFCFHSNGIGDSQSYHTNQVTLHVPIGKMDTYRNANYTNAALGWTTADGWGYFNNVVYLPTNANVFVADGSWNDATKWTHNAVPALGDEVFVLADVTIPNGCTAEADAIILDNGATLTIADGGQLHTNTAVQAVVEKHVDAAPVWENGSDGWLLIASPLQGVTTYTTTAPNHVEGLVVDNYNGNNDGEFHFDFYRWDGSSDHQWRNYRSANPQFDMNNGQGYLYAARENRCLTFTGTVMANADDVDFDPQYGDGWEAFSLYGNPFACDAYLVMEEGTSLAFYVMNAEGSGFEVSEGPVSAMQGFFVASATDGQSFSVSRNAPLAKSNSLRMRLIQGSSPVDDALLRFGRGNMLPKMSFREEGSKVYVPVEGQAFAAVNAEAMGEMPVCFKAAKNGEYTLSFEPENVSFGYLHLVDNLTGADIDLLAQPSYSFKASTGDYASRFKLVFVSEDGPSDSEVSGDFAFFSNGQLIVANDSEGVLQLIDMAGRVVSSEAVSGSCAVSVNATPGLYLLRLVSGENVRTQKIVVQ